MAEPVAQKIREVREALRESQEEFADRFGVRQATVSRWEKGYPVQRKFQQKLADLAGMSVVQFFHTKERPRLIRIVGSVSGGETFVPEETAVGADIEHVLLGLGEADMVAVNVPDDSMRPAYRRGSIIIGSRLGPRDLTRAIGKDCIIKTAEGEGYVKVVHKGSKAGLFRLRSYNPDYEDIVDVEIEWAAPIIWVRRGD